ncbi:GntR family transcriptional regulator [Leucobacter sp. W1153]|uniref:GntR family transcriptional regulator n=1 Tax=Leucobacter sp. W1153 TaxID=3439064 RepID=UPI003F2FEFE2
MFDDAKPIFLQVADRIADDILRGTYVEGAQVPSTNELAAYLRINPATAGKGLNLLVTQQILTKRRGIGMFVAEGARARVAAERQRGFVNEFIDPLAAEARALGLSRVEVIRLLDIALAEPENDEALSRDHPG